MDCSKVQTNIKKIKSTIPKSCKLIIVSKYREIREIECAYNAGHRQFAENRVQSMLERKEHLPIDIEWHMIGHLQSNKIKYISPFIHTIHSVDSEKLLIAINKEAKKQNRIINCLLQVHVAQEESKFGFSIDGIDSYLSKNAWQELKHIQITGLMAMASNTQDTDQINQEFELTQKVFQKLKLTYFSNSAAFNELSIGMTSDYLLAVNAGSTMVRIGSGVFE